MNDRKFNLLDEPWIRVIDENCKIQEVSLIDIFVHANEYKDLCGELPMQDVAVMRVLLAVLHTVFARYDINGNESIIKNSDDAIRRWGDIWKNKKFPEKPIVSYLQSQSDKFDLFHPERPFYQTSAAKIGTEYGAGKLNGMLSESKNPKNPRLFPMIAGEKKTYMKYSQAARWLI